MDADAFGAVQIEFELGQTRLDGVAMPSPESKREGDRRRQGATAGVVELMQRPKTLDGALI